MKSPVQCLLTLDSNDQTRQAYDQLVELIVRDLKRDPGADQLPENEKVRQKIIEGQTKRGMTSEQIFHESAGWRHLETSMSALKRLFEGMYGTNFIESSKLQTFSKRPAFFRDW